MKNNKINEPFTIVPNKVINDKLLTIGAKGMYLYLVSKPDNWKFTVKNMVLDLKDKKHTIDKHLKELKEFGYLKTTPNKNNGGKYNGYNYIINKNPSTEIPITEIPITEIPITEIPITEIPITVKPNTFNNTNLNNTNLNNKERELSHFDFLKLKYENELLELTTEYKPKIKDLDFCIKKFNDWDFKKVTITTFEKWLKKEYEYQNNNSNYDNVKCSDLKKIGGF